MAAAPDPELLKKFLRNECSPVEQRIIIEWLQQTTAEERAPLLRLQEPRPRVKWKKRWRLRQRLVIVLISLTVILAVFTWFICWLVRK